MMWHDDTPKDARPVPTVAEIVDATEAARILGVGRSRVGALKRAGRLVPVATFGASDVYRRADVDALRKLGPRGVEITATVNDVRIY